jgi:di/tricarboxylate transporter
MSQTLTEIVLSSSAVFVLGLIALAAVFFVTEWLRADLVALLLLIILGATNILTPQETLSGFSRSAVITILSIFILTAGLSKTGATRALGKRIMHWSGTSETSLIVVLMATSAFLSLFMNNIAAASVLLPVAIGASRERHVSPSKLMMPLAFGSILGGTATLLTTTNILVSAALRDAGYAAFGLLDFAPIGVPITIVGIVYMLWIGRRLLPSRAPNELERLMATAQDGLANTYALGERWFQAQVLNESKLFGMSLAEAGLGRDLGVNIVAILRNRQTHLVPLPTDCFQNGDILVLQARAEQIAALQAHGLSIRPEPLRQDLLTSDESSLFEIVPAPRSRALGRTLRELHWREKFQINVVAIWRDGRARRVGVGDMPLQFGDALLALGALDRARMLQSEGDFIVATDRVEEGLRTKKMPYAIAIMAVAIVVASIGWLPTAEAMLAGAVLMVLIGALTMDEAYQAIEWRSIFLIAAMLPVGLALSKTGAASALGTSLIDLLGGLGAVAIVAGLLIVTALLTQVMSGQATAVILAPIAIQAAQTIHADPRMFALVVAYGCSLAFLTPLSHPSNVLVMGPGGYKFIDYVRVGTLLTIILIVLILVLISIQGALV